MTFLKSLPQYGVHFLAALFGVYVALLIAVDLVDSMFSSTDSPIPREANIGGEESSSNDCVEIEGIEVC